MKNAWNGVISRRSFLGTQKKLGERRGFYQCVWCDEAYGPVERKEQQEQPAMCTKCKVNKTATEFGCAWAEQSRRALVCTACREKAAAADTLKCFTCEACKPRCEFDCDNRKTRRQSNETAKCNACQAAVAPADTLKCFTCEAHKPRSEFDRANRETRRQCNKTAKCTACQADAAAVEATDTLKCYACVPPQLKPRCEFDNSNRRPRCEASKTRTCKACKSVGRKAPAGRKRKHAPL